MNDELALLEKDDKATIEIVPFGSDDKIKLNVAIVQKMVAVPTRSGKTPDPIQCMKFMMLCRARHLNPFEGDAYLLGYDTQGGPQFSLVTAHQVFLKRAEASEGFDGMESGVILREQNGNILEREGDLTLEDEKLVGGWAKVYRKNTTKPFYRRLKLETFSTGRSRWEKDPAGMIVKCAEADALRSAFPTHLGGLYLPEERPPMEVEANVIPRAEIPAAAPAKTSRANGNEPEPKEKKKRGPGRLRTANEPVVEGGPNAQEVAKRLDEEKFTVSDLLLVAIDNKWIEPPAGYEDGKPETLADVPLASVGEDRLGVFIEDWDTVAEQMQALRAKRDS